MPYINVEVRIILKCKRYLSIIVFIGVIVLVYASGCNKIYAEESKEQEAKELIMIDPGHGGFDGGAEANGVKEKNINLSIGLFLKEELNKNKYRVVMTREKDEAVKLDKLKRKTRKSEDLEARCKMQTDSKCDMFISIHLNAFPQSQYFGAQVWYSDNAESKRLSSIIQRNFREDINPLNNRIDKAALDSYKVLRGSDTIPAVIVECGFLSNPQEAEKLNDKGYQKKIAETIAKSVNEFYLAKHKTENQ